MYLDFCALGLHSLRDIVNNNYSHKPLNESTSLEFVQDGDFAYPKYPTTIILISIAPIIQLKI